ncbi:MAG TPA: NUDIX domain-containing protein [Candidatus Dojkabacteria bacterium]|nr:NUDIX domain-containing protein [Candidatus Dojkabacteria bacterium]
MSNMELRKNRFITNNGSVKSFSLRASAVIKVGDRYLMVLNEVANKYKHPGGHLHLNESLFEGLKRELMEEIGLVIDKVDYEKVLFDSVLKDGNLMINALFPIEIGVEKAEKILLQSPLPTKLLKLEELNNTNTWESEIVAIKNITK